MSSSLRKMERSSARPAERCICCNEDRIRQAYRLKRLACAVSMGAGTLPIFPTASSHSRLIASSTNLNVSTSANDRAGYPVWVRIGGQRQRRHAKREHARFSAKIGNLRARGEWASFAIVSISRRLLSGMNTS